MKKLFFFCAALTAFAGCSKDTDQSEFTDADLQGKAFLSVGFVNGSGTRANMEDSGSASESAVSEVTVLLFDEANMCLGVVDFSGTTIGNSGGSDAPAATPSEPKLVPANTKKVFVVINNSGWTLTSAAVEGKSWNTINTAIDASSAVIAADNNFVMSSAGTFEKGALTDVKVYKAKSDSQTDVDQAKAEAKANAAVIKIDRMAAKVSIKENTNGVIAPAQVTFEFLGWELSVTNKSVRLYADVVRYDNATPAAVPGIYRRDKNYLMAEQPDLKSETAMKAAFNYLVNEPLSPVARVGGSNAYCLENTIEAVAQKLGVTTKAVVRATYTPEGWAKGVSFFMWNGVNYQLDALKAAYLANSGLKADLAIFLKKADIYTDADGNIDTFVANLTPAQFTATSGITGRYCAVRYYHESVCYYDVLVFHDQSVTTKMALGRYGVVRNNWYSLSIDKVTGPGTPWIPDPSDPDPENPTTPDTDDDKGNAYLSVQMTINPWTFWTQGVELN